MAPLFFFLSGRCHATRSVRTSFCCTINRTLLPYQQSSVDTATKVHHPYGNRPPSRLSAPQYGRNEHQVTGEAQEGCEGYPPCGEDVGTEGIVATALSCHEQEARQDQRYGKGGKDIVRAFHEEAFQSHRHYFDICSGK